MITLREIDDHNPALAYSPIARAVGKTFEWIDANGPIPLTPSKSFKRVFVQWAAKEFDWPGHTEEDLYAVNKVLNEQDFLPLTLLHQLLVAMKLGRHYNGHFRLSKTGQDLVGRPGRIFNTVVPALLFQVDHSHWYGAERGSLPGNWDVYLNVLNIETEDGATGDHLRRVLFGEPETGPFPSYDYEMGSFYLEVLRPLCWAGLLQQHDGAGYRTRNSHYAKTPLWRAALTLETDVEIHSATRH